MNLFFEALKKYKFGFLLFLTLALSVAIIVAITLKWYNFQERYSSGANIYQPSVTEEPNPTLSNSEEASEELDLGNRIAGTEESIEIYSTNPMVRDQVELVRLYIENGEVLDVTSTLMAFPACGNDRMFTQNEVCLDVAKTTPMNVNELLATVKIRWDEDKEGKIWNKSDAGVYILEDVLGINVGDSLQVEEATDNIINTRNIPFGNTSYKFLNTNELQLLIIVGALVSVILVFISFKNSLKGKKISRILKVFVFFVEIVGIFVIVNNIVTNYFYPDSASADIAPVERDQLVQPVLNVAVTMGYGDAGKNYVCGGGSCCFGPPGLCHTGIDLGIVQNIYSAGRGIVQQASFDSTGYGNTVIIRHNSSSGIYYTQYSHLASINVNQGDEVDENTVIGYMGATGNAYGAHLHFELRNNLGYTASSFSDPTAIVYRQRGSVPIVDEGVACGEHCNSDSDCEKGDKVQAVECDQSVNPSNNKCIILSCDTGYYIDGCTCKAGTVTPSPTNTPIKTPSPTPTQPGGTSIYCGPMDVDGNNKIDVADLVNFANKYNKKCSDNYNDAKYGALDANHDAKINFYDIIKFKSFYNKGILF